MNERTKRTKNIAATLREVRKKQTRDKDRGGEGGGR